MIIRMTTSRRPQQRYDHRLRDLVHSTGDATIATDLGVPRSTARGWLADTFAPAKSVAVLVEAGRTATPSETTPAVLEDAGVENVNAQVDELITTEFCAGFWRSAN